MQVSYSRKLIPQEDPNPIMETAIGVALELKAEQTALDVITSGHMLDSGVPLDKYISRLDEALTKRNINGLPDIKTLLKDREHEISGVRDIMRILGEHGDAEI